MFAIGDKVVYPMHGAGIIESIEEKSILGETKLYYILKMLQSSMQVMVPVENTSTGLRAILSDKDLDEMFEIFSKDSTPMDSNWNRRNRDNMEKIKTGDICQIAEVIRNLLRIDRVKKLSAGEKKLLQNAKKILSSEISIIKGIELQEAEKMIDTAVV